MGTTEGLSFQCRSLLESTEALRDVAQVNMPYAELPLNKQTEASTMGQQKPEK